MQPHFRVLALTALVSLGSACTFAPRKPAPITPQRPFFSVNTQTTAAETFEVESGVALDPSDTLDFPTIVKWGASDQTELFTGFSPYRRIFVTGDDPDGFGDLTLGTRHRFLEETDERPSAAVRLLTKLPTSNDNGTGSEEIDFLAAVSATKQIAGFTANAFYQLGVIGQPLGGTEIEHGLAAVLLKPIEDSRITVGAETALLLRPESDIEIFQVTGNVRYFLDDATAFDAGLTVGLTDEAPDAVLLFGVTHNFGAASWESQPQ